MKTITKIILTLLISNCSLQFANAQNTAITDDSTYMPNSSAILDVKSINKGVLLPRLTTVQRNEMINPAVGLLVFDTDENAFYYYTSVGWTNVSAGNSNDIIGKTNPNKVYLKDTNSNFGIGTTSPSNKLDIKADADNGIDQAIFNVVNNVGDTVFAVYPQGVRINVNEETTKAKSKKGGFAVGGYKPSKGTVYNDYLSVNSDSIKASKSFLLPRMTTTERDNLGFTPSDALIIFNMTDACMQIYKNNEWSNIWCFNCAPAIIIQPVDMTICSGTNTNFFLSATGTSLSYKWQVSTDGENTWNNIITGGTSPIYSGVTSSNLSLSNIPVENNGYKYRCNVTASCLPYVTSSVVTLNVVSTPPIITTQPTNQVLSVGCTASFSIASPGFGVSYLWQQSADGINWNTLADGGTFPNYSGTTTSLLTLSNVPLIYNNYKYRCTVGNSCGANVISNVVNLTINSAPTITAQPIDQQLITNGIATFTVSVTETGVFYQWQQSSDDGISWIDIINGGTNPFYSNANTSSLSLSNIPIGVNGYKFRCEVSHLCLTSIISDAATFNYIPFAVTTTVASNIKSITATSGGNVTSDGGTTVTTRGVCWGVSIDPDMTDNYTINGSGIGGFTSNLTGLTLGFTYYVRAYAINNMDTVYGNQISFIATLAIGDNYQAGIVAYILQPVDLGYIEGETHGLIAAPSDQSEGADWGLWGGCGTVEISGADGTAIGTGNQNTIDILNGCADAGIAARICGDLVLGGYDDWYLPSKDELNQLYVNRAKIGGFVSFYYYTSSEVNNNHAWCQSFSNGNQYSGYDYKYGNALRVRAVRNF